MKRALFYFTKIITLISLVFRNRKLTMLIMKQCHKFNNVKFIGSPRYIHPNAVLDASGELIIENNVVISRGVLILTHDYSYTAGLASIDERPHKDIAFIKSVTIGEGSFIGANSIILPGITIGKYTLVAAGSVVTQNIPSFSIVAGNPAKFMTDIRNWTKLKKTAIIKKTTSKY